MEKTQKLIWGALAAVAVIGGLGASGYYHHSHFNKNVTINGVRVGGLTSEAAYQKLASQKRSNDVYLNGKKIYEGTSTSSGYTSADKAKVTKVLKEQATILPSAKKTNYKLIPSELDTSQLSAMKKAIKVEVDKLNQNRVMAVDAKAVWKDNKVMVTSPKKGTAYDTSKIQAELSNQLAADSIQLTAKVKTPLTKNSAAVKKEVAALKKLSNKKITYKVENKSYTLTSDDIITKATYQNGQYQFDTAALDQEIAKINKAQSTLGKSFKFKTHAGNTITTSAQGSYGWRISTTKAAKTLTDALLKGTTSVSAKADVYGIGYNTGGVGYGTTSNNGIGDTYAEVSISAQTAWFYKDGKLVYSARVVTGKQSSGDDTPTGVYYIMYKQRNTTLRGIGDTGKAYASPVSYWAPFTESGCGFHDASWRTDWSTTAYVNNGSNGCVNMHTYDAPNAFNDLSVDEPVVIY